MAVLYHHENVDGSGYPEGISGEDMSIFTKIIHIADVYDALVCERVYKKAFPKDIAFHMIMNGECGVFSPKLLECFQKVKNEFERIAGVS